MFSPLGTNFSEIPIKITIISIEENALENVVCKINHLLRLGCVNCLDICWLLVFLAAALWSGSWARCRLQSWSYGAHLNIKIIFPVVGIPIKKIRVMRLSHLPNWDSYTGMVAYSNGPQSWYLLALICVCLEIQISSYIGLQCNNKHQLFWEFFCFDENYVFIYI